MYHIQVTSEHPRGDGFCIAVKKSGLICSFSNLGTVKGRREQLNDEEKFLCATHLRSNRLAASDVGRIVRPLAAAGSNPIFSAVHRHNSETGEDKVYLAGTLTPEMIAHMLPLMFRQAGIEFEDIRVVRIGPVSPHILIDGNVLYIRKGW